MDEEQQRLDLKFSAWCAGWYQHKRGEFLGKVVAFFQVLGSVSSIAGILTFGRAPSWFPYLALGVGISSLIFVQLRRLDIKAQQHRDISAQYYAIASRLDHDPKVSVTRLARDLEAVHAKSASIGRDQLQTLHMLGSNAWQAYMGHEGGRYRVTRLERWTANIWDYEPPGGWRTRLSPMVMPEQAN